MFKQELKNETISLGAIYQACNEIKKIAWQGEINNNIIEPLINSVYQTTSEEIEDVFISIKRLNSGLDFLRRQLVGDAFSRDGEVSRYFEAIGILVKNMNKKDDVLNKLRTELTRQSMPINEDNLDQHALFLSELYLSTISTVEPRIIVNGDNKYLTDKKNAAMIRSLLLCAIRSYILWQQSGGSKFRIFIFKKKIAELAVKL
jgi:high frequency lysogenization protein|tara:strand:- start:185 stop:793 length:609 start_codon:yes stop_codon:yes gene_type:complete